MTTANDRRVRTLDRSAYWTNNSKKDYNLEETGQVWDGSSKNAHWKNREPGSPFFAISNLTSTHEGKVNNPQAELTHDVAEAPLPAYHPDTPESGLNHILDVLADES